MALPAGPTRQIVSAVYVAAMAAVIVGLDIAFFRGHFWERLAANVGTVTVFAAVYFRFFRHR